MVTANRTFLCIAGSAATMRQRKGRHDMTFRCALLAVTALALPIVARAQPVTGLYLGAGVGVNIPQDQTVKSIAGSAVTGTIGSRSGPATVASVGWGFGNGLRAEIQGNFSDNQFHGASGFGAGSRSGGREQKFGMMYNLLYDFVGLTPWMQPYVGAGVGYEGVREQGLTVTGGGGSFAANTATKGALGYQAIVGTALPINAAPGLAMTAEYRFVGLAGDRSYGGALATGRGSVASSIKLNNEYNHAVLLGVRYNFGQAAPTMAMPAVPAQAVQPARSYLVFFDWDKATLTDRARQIIKEAADSSTRVQYTRIEANGYADTSGTPQYNQGLSLRRAQSVAAELVKDGVPSNVITIQGFGDTHLLVPTGAGVREPQNRRVEIVVR
jgi:outer membrane protein OmpA-like peptidoglycan-associated protein